jgi:AcrR family transcriptional regulator
MFRHFRSKEELFEAAVVAPLQAAAARLARSAALSAGDQDPAPASGYGRVRRHLHVLREDMDELSPLVGLVLFSSADSAAARFRERIAPLLAETERVIAVNLPDWPPHEPATRLAVQACFGAVWFRATADRLAGRRGDPGSEAERLAALLVDGVRLREPDEDDPRDA